MAAIDAGRVRRNKSGGKLRAFQEALSKRIGNAGSVIQKDLRLGVRIGGRDWLLALPDAGEVIAVPPITFVPMTKAWVLGVANVRGRLYAVADLALFFGEKPTALQAQARLLLVGQRNDSNAAILVERVLGLRSVADLVTLSSDGAGWALAEFQDAQGQHFSELALARLLAAPEFASVAA